LENAFIYFREEYQVLSGDWIGNFPIPYVFNPTTHTGGQFKWNGPRHLKSWPARLSSLCQFQSYLLPDLMVIWREEIGINEKHSKFETMLNGEMWWDIELGLKWN